MRRWIMFISLIAALVTSESCCRRDFAERTTGVSLILKVNTQIVNTSDVPEPEVMRVDLYDVNTGRLAYTDYVGPDGGYIHPSAGNYDIVLYNIGTESTQVRNESVKSDIEAFTSEVSAFLKGQLAQFLANVAKSKTHNAETKTPEEEKIVYEPDYLFVGKADNVNIPVIYEDDPDREILIEMDAHSVVETWKVSVTNIIGMEYVRNVVAIISGQAASHYLGRGENSDKAVSIYFQKHKDEENNSLVGTFNTFGKHPFERGILNFDINVTDTGGAEHHFHFDVDSQFMDNPNNHIIIDEAIEIEEPKVGGGGFNPTVGEWEDVKTDIIL